MTILTADVQSENITATTRQVAIGTSVQFVHPANPFRRRLVITQITGTQICYVGFKPDLAEPLASGLAIYAVGAAAKNEITIYAKGAIYGVATTAPQTVSILEESAMPGADNLDVQSLDIQGRAGLVVVSSAAATRIIGANSRRRRLVIRQLTGTQAVYLGNDSLVSSSAGVLLGAAAAASMEWYGKGEVWGSCGVADQTVTFIEESTQPGSSQGQDEGEAVDLDG